MVSTNIHSHHWFFQLGLIQVDDSAQLFEAGTLEDALDYFARRFC